MRKLFFLFLIALSAISAFGQTQNDSNCPALLFSIEGEGVVDEDQNIRIYAFVHNDERDNNGIITENISFKERLKYKWKISPEFETILEKPWSIFLKPQPEMQNKQVTINVEVEGFPEGCKNNFSTEFTVRIQYLCRLPITIDEYEIMSLKDEKARLDAAVTGLNESLKENKNSTLLFYIYSKNEAEFKKRKSFISNYLENSRKVLSANFAVIDERDAEAVKPRVRIYLTPEKYSSPEK